MRYSSLWAHAGERVVGRGEWFAVGGSILDPRLKAGASDSPAHAPAFRLGSCVNLKAQNPPTMNQLRARAGDSRTRCIIATAGGRGFTSAFPPLQASASFSGRSKV